MTASNLINFIETRIKIEGNHHEIALMLVEHLTKKDRSDIYLDIHKPYNINLFKVSKFLKIVNSGKPLAQIFGQKNVDGINIKINKYVLIPREETVYFAKLFLELSEKYGFKDNFSLVDVGTGSGIIPRLLLRDKASIKVIATDISKKALKIAKVNLKDFPITFYKGDLLSPLVKLNIKTDTLISNLPYIPDKEVIDSSVAHYEPKCALYGGKLGCEMYLKLIDNLSLVLNDKFFVGFEIHPTGQSQLLIERMESIFSNVNHQVIKDFSNLDRYLFFWRI
jgi:release factor glutamine methyltransferase